MKIVSRIDEDEHQNQRLRELLEVASDGAISDRVSAEVAPGEDLDELVTQVDVVFCAMLETIDALTGDVNDMIDKALVAELQAIDLRAAVMNVTYDECLDHAAADMMDALCSSGAADVDGDGDLVFDERLTLTKGDLKPMIKTVIERWVQLKVK